MFQPSSHPWTRLALATVLLCALVLVMAPAALAANTWIVDSALADEAGCVSPTFQCKTIEAAVTRGGCRRHH